MKKTILITGSTDGIGLLTAKKLASLGHDLLIHGRNIDKLDNTKELLLSISNNIRVDTFVADLSSIDDVKNMIDNIKEKYNKLDIVINNAGVYKSNSTITNDGFDIRFVVNTFAPYLITKELLPLLNSDSRVVNLSSAAQANVDLDALSGKVKLSDGEAYAQSKLALTMFSSYMGESVKKSGIIIVSVNPASFLGSKMVKEAYGIDGKDINIGADILVKASLSDEFKSSYGKYFDNDIGEFTLPHFDALDKHKCKNLIESMDNIIKKY